MHILRQSIAFKKGTSFGPHRDFEGTLSYSCKLGRDAKREPPSRMQVIGGIMFKYGRHAGATAKFEGQTFYHESLVHTSPHTTHKVVLFYE